MCAATRALDDFDKSPDLLRKGVTKPEGIEVSEEVDSRYISGVRTSLISVDHKNVSRLIERDSLDVD